MDAQNWLTLAAVLVSLGSLYFASRAANAAIGQTRIQRQIREDSAQPYVWADLRPFEEHGQFIVLVVGNSGPTVATNVRVKVTPDLVGATPEDGRTAQDALERGFSALAPGRTITWNLGVYRKVLSDERADLAYSSELRGAFAVPPGTLNGVAVAIDKLRKEYEKHST